MTLVVGEAPSGEEGIQLVRQGVERKEPYEIIFVDWQMPGIDGIETGKRISALPNLAVLPHLVMVTSYGREEVLKQAEKTVFEGILIKPITPSMLHDSVVQALSVEREPFRAAAPHPAVGIDLEAIRGARVLLVEDNEINREVAFGLLEDAHLSLDTAENGEIAVQKITHQEYDLVLMDMQMPVMDGVTATKAIRSNPRFQSLPVVGMTANAMDRDRQTCLEAGMNDYLTKPIDPDKLFDALLRWITPRVSPGTAAQGPISTRPLDPISGPDSSVFSGMDTAAALKRSGGNLNRYESLLRRFAESQATAIDDIRVAMVAKDTSTARRLAHSLKGAAANLGLSALAEVAARAESAIESEQDIPLALESLSHSLDSSLDTIRRALPKEAAPTNSAVAVKDLAVATQPLVRLKKLLENDDGDAADFILDARPSLCEVLTVAEIDALVQQVGNFAYSNALQSLSAIATRLSIPLE